MNGKLWTRRGLCAFLAALCLLQPVVTDAASSKEIREEINALQEEADALEEQQALLEAQLADNLEQLDAALGQLEQLRDAYKARIRAMEEEGELSYWAVIFEAESFTDLLDRVNMIREIAEADQQRLEKLAAAAKAVEDARASLEAEKENLETVKKQLAADQALLEEKRAQADALLRELISRGAEFEALLEASEETEQALLLQIAQKEDEFDEAKYQEWLATYVPPKPEHSESTGGSSNVNTSGWISPLVSYKLTSPFGMRDHPITGEYRMHNGIDMAAPAGTPIYAAKGGQVSIAAYSSTAGFYVQIDHGEGYRSVYMHMTEYKVSAGQYVAQGQLIGYVGNTGQSKGNHLHFGISLNGSYVNPIEYIR